MDELIFSLLHGLEKERFIRSCIYRVFVWLNMWEKIVIVVKKYAIYM